jgi:RecA-family ATPase
MTREEMVQRARLTHDWASLLTSLDFRKIRDEVLKDKRSLSVWQRETSKGPVEFWVSSEDEAAYLGNGTESSKGRWEKLDFILTFHAGGDWSLAEYMIASGDVLLSGPLAEIAQESRNKDLAASLESTLEDKLEYDPQFRRAYEKSLREIAARQAAEETLSGSSGSKIRDLQEMTDYELAEVTGLIDWDALWADETEERWFVKDLLCEGRAHACPAESGIGKSLLWAEIGAGLSSGRSVLGYPAQEPIRVLYLDHENTPKGDIKPRLQAMGYRPEDLGNFIYLSFPSIEALNTKLGGKSLTELVDYFQPNLVFIDTFSRFVEGDENSSKVAQDFYEHAGRELKRKRIAYLRIDHIGKDASRGARGSSAKIDDLDLIWTMAKTKEANVFILKNQKARVPISQQEILIERTLSPLKHTSKSGASWPRLIAIAAKHELAVSLIEKRLEAKEPMSQGKVWNDLGPTCKANGISRNELFQALIYVQSGFEQPLEEAS